MHRQIAMGVALVLLGCTGCHVENHQDGRNDDVKISTPFGGMSVKTNDAVVQSNVGMASYPGAALVQKDKDNGAADVNLSFGNFHLGVKALSYRTPDSPDKVIAFYRKDMARYGAVLLCHDHRPVGTPTATQDGLTCNDKNQDADQTYDGGHSDELKAGSKLHQHIVAIDHEGTGTKFGLIALDLPGHLGGDNDRE
jgi:hypothetical protein